VLDAMGPITYCDQNGLLDAAFPRGALNYWKAQFVRELSDDCIGVLLDRFAACPSPMGQIVVEDFHGAVSRVPVQQTACAMRATGFNVVIASQWMDPKETAENLAWTRDTFAALNPFLGTMRYVNYLDHDDESGDPAAAVYGSNYPRLKELKAKYDPDNVFHRNVNIRPGAA
jgi:hypothetical protein